MERSVNKTTKFKNMMIALSLMIAFLLSLAPDMAFAKRGGDQDNRLEFVGLVQARPESALHGEWVIGGRIIITDADTEFDQTEGDLVIGSCAKVELRNGRVHEIDSEPMRDCQ